jgi:hypothetical protein
MEVPFHFFPITWLANTQRRMKQHSDWAIRGGGTTCGQLVLAGSTVWWKELVENRHPRPANGCSVANFRILTRAQEPIAPCFIGFAGGFGFEKVLAYSPLIERFPTR